MSLEDIKSIIQGYEPHTVKPDEIESLKLMLEHESFEPLYTIIFDKLKEIREHTNQKTPKKNKKEKIKENKEAGPSLGSYDDAIKDLEKYIFTLNYFIDPSKPEDPKKPNSKK